MRNYNRFKNTIWSSNTRNTNLYANLCTKITCGNTRGHGGNICENDNNTCDRTCLLKLNNVDFHIIFHVEFGGQVGVTNIIVSDLIYYNYEKW